jgi:hypothetical protein
MDLRAVAMSARCEWEQRFTVERYQREMTEAMARVMNQHDSIVQKSDFSHE